MFMTATILRVDPQSLLVRDEATGQEVLVLFRNARMFSVGERIRIAFSGQMTASIPPQITATSIQRLVTPAPTPVPPSGASQMRATVQQVGDGFLMVRNTQSQLMRVDYAYARHFCPRQQVIVRYETIFLSNPPNPSRVVATDVTPIC